MTVADIEGSQRRLRGRARALLGVTGEERPSRFWSPTGRQDSPSDDKKSGTLAALAALNLADELAVIAFALVGPEASRALGVSKGTISSVAVLGTLVLIASALPFAAYVSRRARRGAVALAAGLVWALCSLAAAFAVSLGALLALVIVRGAARGAARAVHTPLVADSYRPGARARALSLHAAGGALGAVLAPLLVAVLSSAVGLSWRGVLLVVGFAGLALVLAGRRLGDPGYGTWDTSRIREAVRDDAGDVLAGDDEPLADARFGEVVRRVMLVPTVRLVLVAYAFVGMLLVPLQSFTVFYLDERWDLAPGGRSLFVAAVAAVTVVALVLFGRRGDTELAIGPSRLVLLVSRLLALVPVGLAVAVVSPVLAGVFVGLAVALSSVAVVAPALTVVLFTLVPPRARPHVAALSAIFLLGVGGVGGSLLLNGIDRRFGIAWAILSLGLPAAVAAAVLRSGARTADADLDRAIDEVIEGEEVRVLERQGRHLPMLSCRHVDFSYGQLQVLFDVDFTIDDGEIVALLGTNGAGKSTLLRVISGLGLPSRGSVTFRGTDITYLDAERRLGLGVTQVPGGKATFGPLTVVENLRVYGHSLGRAARRLEPGIEATFEAFPRLGERRNQLASTLSGGEQQMLALGKAFILEPRLLLIDELSLGLAPKIVGDLLDMVRRINAGGTAVVLVEQSVNIALSLVDHAYFMEKGEIRFDGRAAELLDRRDLLRSVFLEGASKGIGT